jgi:hypothetical protein
MALKSFKMFDGVNNLHARANSLAFNPTDPNVNASITNGFSKEGVSDDPDNAPVTQSQQLYTYRILCEFANSTGSIYKWIVGWIDDDNFSESVDGTWDRVIESFGGMLGEINKTLSLFGASIVTKYMHQKIWTDSTSPVFDINLKFVAENNAYQEVYAPCRYLQMMTVPSERHLTGNGAKDPLLNTIGSLITDTTSSVSNTFLVPPGGSKINLDGIIDVDSGAKVVRFRELHVGKLFVLKDLLIKSVDVEWDLKNVDKNGYPLTATAKVSFEALTLWTTQTINTLKGSQELTDYKQRYDAAEQFSGVNLGEIIKQIPGKLNDILNSLNKK